MTYGPGNPCLGFGHTQKCTRIKSVNGISIPPFPIPLLTVGCPITINTDLKKYKKKICTVSIPQSKNIYYHPKKSNV
jgi:hypothetical protein